MDRDSSRGRLRGRGDEQAAAIGAMLVLLDDITLPDPRVLVPEMVSMHQRHPQLNVMNVKLVAAAGVFEARGLLSSHAAEGILPRVLDAEGLVWKVIKIGLRRGERQ